MLKYTGHPFVDVGVATIVAMAGKGSPEEVTEEDLDRAASYLEDFLLRPTALRSFLYTHVYPNAYFGQPKGHDNKRGNDVANRLHGYRRTARAQGNAVCVFCSKPAIERVARSKVPLLNAEELGNFSPQGIAGLPICGYCLLAVHMMPLGAIRCGNGKRLLIIQGNLPAVTQQFAHRAYKKNTAALSLANLEEGGLPDHVYPKTRLVEALLDSLREGERHKIDSLIAYYFTNHNQYPRIGIYELPSSVIRFLREAESDYYAERRKAWHMAIVHSWEDAQEASAGRNKLFEDLFNLPAKALKFFYQYIWSLHNWELASLFLRKVMNMDPDRLQLLYELGSRFAAYTLKRHSFYFEFGRESIYAAWRRKLLRAADDYARQYGQLLISADEFVRAFTAPRGAEFNDWKLARDIVMLRIIEERLSRGDKLSEEDALIPEEEQPETTVADEV